MMEPKKLTFYQRMAKKMLEFALASNKRVLHRKVTVNRARRRRFSASFREIRQKYFPFGLFNKKNK